jgi:ABC-type multidrug transport system fused ATPase/permease subunit
MEKNNESSDGGKSPAQERSGEAAAVEEYLELSKGNYHIGTNSVGVSENGSAVFRDITVWGGEAALVYQDTVASMFMAPVRLIHKLLSHKKSTRKAILQGVDGIIHEGEMLLVLGRPGSGSTTLLKTLAGMTESFHGWNGIVSYFGLSIDIIKKKFRGDVVYNAEGKSSTKQLDNFGSDRQF